MRSVYIALDEDHKPLGVVLARTPEEADAFFLGTGTIPNRIERVDPNDAELPSVVVLLTSSMVPIGSRDRYIRVMCRGL